MDKHLFYGDSMTASLSPFVYWAQTKDNITLRVDLKDVKDPKVELHPRKLMFAAPGHGAKGLHNYGFTLHFSGELNPAHSTFNVTDHQVNFTLSKNAEGWWDRLTATPQKPAWLKVDFERWRPSDDDLDEEDMKRDIHSDYPDLLNKLKKEELGYIKEDLKMVYLVLYNLCQFVGFLYILSVLLVRYVRDGPESITTAYEATRSALIFCQLIQFLEVMHVLFGYTKGSIIPPILQVTGRAFVLLAMIEFEPRMHSKPVVFYMIVAWSVIEVIRYPYYIAHLHKKDIGLLTWLRYTAWIPLYPFGILCEGVIILRNLPFCEETNRLSITLPNEWNFTFHLPTFLKLYLLLLFFPGGYSMMTHMYRARVKKLNKDWRKMD